MVPFISKPNLARVSLIHSGHKALQKDQALATYIRSLLSKNTIERVKNVKSRFLQSPVSSPRLRKDIPQTHYTLFLAKTNYPILFQTKRSTSLGPGPSQSA